MNKLFTIMSLILLYTLSSSAEYAKGDKVYFIDDEKVWTVTGVTSEYVRIDGTWIFDIEKELTYEEAEEKLIPVVWEILTPLGLIQIGHFVKTIDNKFYKVRAILESQQLWLKDATDISNYDIGNKLMSLSDVAFTGIDCIENTDYCYNSEIYYDGSTWIIKAISSDGTALIHLGGTTEFKPIDLIDNINKGYVSLL